MMVDFSKLSDDDVRALASGDMSRVSTEGLQHLAGSPQTKKPKGASGSWDVPAWKKRVSGMTHTVLPMAGGIAGGVIGGGGAGTAGSVIPGAGTVAGISAGSVAGGALGYAIGEQGADALDEFLGVVPVRGIKESLTNAAGNVYEGAQAEALGLVMGGAGKALWKGAKATAKGAKSLLPLSQEGAQKEVSRLLTEFQKTGDKQFLKQAQSVADSVPGFKYTYGMGANNRDLISLERSVISGSAGKPGLEGVQGQADDLLQGNVRAVESKLRGMQTGSKADFVDDLARQRGGIEAERTALSQVDGQATGRQVLDAVESAQAPYKAQMQKLEEMIPDYPVQIDGTRATIKDLLGSKKLSDEPLKEVEKVSRAIAERFTKNGSTLHNLMGARRTVNDEISKAAAQGKDSVVAALMQVKSSLDDDVAAVASMARTGKLAEHKGVPVFPDKLAAELEENVSRLTAMQTKQAPDIDAALKTVNASGRPTMRVAGETEQSFHKRLAKEYERITGQNIPTKAIGDEKMIADLVARNKTIQETLQNVEPGQDVAALLNAYNNFSSKEFFGRFGKDSIRQAKDAQRLENVAQKFATDTGVDDIIKAVGRDEAQTAMRGHYQKQLGTLLEKNPSDAQVMRWFQENRRQLGKLGLHDEFLKTVRNQQGYRELVKITGADTEQLFATIMSGKGREQRQALQPILARVKNNPKAMAGLKSAFLEYFTDKSIRPLAADRVGFGRVADQLKQLDPTIQKLFTPKEVAELNKVRQAVAITQRMTQGSPIGGSQTQELLKAAGRVADGKPQSTVMSAIISAGAYGVGSKAGGPLVGVAAAGAVQTVREVTKRHGDKAVRMFFARAMFDPEYAKTLGALTRQARKPTAELVRHLNAQVARMAVITSNRPDGD